ncbi:MAG TPA: hypothetical protein P5341_10320 [Hyphomonas sp.]|nr:hypothetical protein [Hyphomonas sp.]
MRAKSNGFMARAAGAGALLLLGGCTTDDLNAFAEGMAMAADEMSVTLTMVPAWGCDYNANGYLVCDDTGDGYADRYGDPDYDYIGYAAYVPVTPLVRVNGRGKAFEYDGGCDCWRREPSLDEAPPPGDHGHHGHDDWDD